MKVVEVVTRLSGGVGRYLASLDEELRARGVEVIVMAGSVAESEAEVRLLDHAPIYVAGLQRSIGGPSDASAIRSLTRSLRELRPDVVHTHLSKAGVVGRVAAHRAGVHGIIHTFHGHLLNSYFSPPVAWSFLQVERWLAPRSSALVAVSENVRDELQSRGVGEPGQWTVLPTVTRSLHGPFLDKSEARSRFGLAGSSKVLGFFGRLEAVKNCQLFLEAGRAVESRNGDVVLLVAGEGSQRAQLETWSQEHLPGRVHFVGWQHEPLWAMAACDVVVSSSRNEGLGLSLMEAAAVGVPIVATAVGGVGDVVEDGVNGLLVAPDDANALAVAIERVLHDPALARDLVARGSATVRERFDVGKGADRLLDIYQECAARGAAPKRWSE